MQLLIDMDDVLSEFVSVWIARINEKYNRSVRPDQILQWDITPYFEGLTVKEIFSPLNEEGFWLSVSVKQDAPYYVKKLIDDGHEIYIVTATHHRSVAEKFEWIQKYFPFIKWEQMIITSRKQLIKGDILIDDGVHNMLGGSYAKILFDSPHNWLTDESSIGAVRVKTWAEAYKAINDLA